jgi:hypothetical protein
MAVIIRIDVDRPYGRRPLFRHLASRCASDLFFPRTPWLGYLRELGEILQVLHQAHACAHVFFRRCTLPSAEVVELIEDGGHDIGLHLENSRTYDTFCAERLYLARHTGRPVLAVSKHGSGGIKYGRRHYAPYEPQRYVEWAARENMCVFFGNLEDPTLAPKIYAEKLWWFPSAFWLEPSWRDTAKFPVEWLLEYARHHDVVLLVHPENVLADDRLARDFRRIISTVETRIIS